MSPTGRALSSAAAAVVFLLWWTAALDIGGVTPREVGAVADGVDYRPLVVSLVDALFWPVTIYLLCRVAFDLARAWRPYALRFIAIGDAVFAAAWLAGLVWLWRASALGPVIGVDSLDQWVDRMGTMVREGGDVAAIVTLVVTIMTLTAAWSLTMNLGRLLIGRRG